MRLTKTCIYAIQASIYLATVADKRRFVPVRRVADQLGISHHFLLKILRGLSARGVLASYRGPNGGVGLARSANEIKLMDIIVALDRGDLFDRCILGLPDCGDERPCPLHDHWRRAREQMQSSFENTTLAEMAEGIRNGTQRITDDAERLPSKPGPGGDDPPPNHT